MFIIIYFFIFFSALFYYCYCKRHPGKNNLPPGSMGWPYVGETLRLYSTDPNTFFSEKLKRYGDVFKTNILGCPCVMLASPEAAKFVLMSNAELFPPSYPKSKERLIGPNALFFHQGEYYSMLRKIVQSSLSLENVRKLIPGIEDVAVSTLEFWACKGTICTFHEMKKFSFEVGILAIFGELKQQQKEELKHKYSIVDKGYNSFPINIPGTPYHKALMARRRLSEIVGKIILERRRKENVQDDHLLELLLKFESNKGLNLDHEQIVDNIIGVLFAAQDTTAAALTWIIKYLNQDQKLLEAVKDEQKLIYTSNNMGTKNLSWNQIRNMPLTYKVILESLRMSSIVSFIFREAVVDIEYNGWKVMPLIRNIHHSSQFYNNPQRFDPHRYEVAPKPNTFLPFGIGAHSCPGHELAKLEMLVLIHHLVNRLRWKVVGPEEPVQYSPFPVPNNGLSVQFLREPLCP